MAIYFTGIKALLEFIACIFSPAEVSQVGIFYLFWMSLFVGINIIWDILSKKTGPFHPKKLKDKTSMAFAASTFCSSLIILLSIFQPSVAKAVGDAVAPLVLVGVIGLLNALGEICPHNISETK